MSGVKVPEFDPITLRELRVSLADLGRGCSSRETEGLCCDGPALSVGDVLYNERGQAVCRVASWTRRVSMIEVKASGEACYVPSVTVDVAAVGMPNLRLVLDAESALISSGKAVRS